MTFISKYRELRRLFKAYYEYLVFADKELTKNEKVKLINEIFRLNAMIENIEEMPFHRVRKICDHAYLKAPSRLNRDKK